MHTLRVKLVDENSKTPIRSTENAAGLDLFAAHDLVIKSHNKAILDTGVALEIPAGCYGRIAPRSTASYKHHFITGAGVIDADYRGTIKVVIFNLGSEDFYIRTGESHTQLILERICFPQIKIVRELSQTNREKAEIDRYHFTQQLWKVAYDQ
jgi:dUTP pyrophosphatase